MVLCLSYGKEDWRVADCVGQEEINDESGDQALELGLSCRAGRWRVYPKKNDVFVKKRRDGGKPEYSFKMVAFWLMNRLDRVVVFPLYHHLP